MRFSLCASQAEDELSEGPGDAPRPRPEPWVWGHDHPGLFPWLALRRVWERQAAAFGDRMPVLTPTVPVWEAGWFSEYLRGLDLHACLLVGWSLGGMLLLEALSRLTDPPPNGLVLWGVAPVFTTSRLPLGPTPGCGPGHAPRPDEKPVAGAGGVCRTRPAPGRRRLPPRPGRRLRCRRPPVPWRQASIYSVAARPQALALPPACWGSRHPGRRTGSWTRPRDGSFRNTFPKPGSIFCRSRASPFFDPGGGF